MHVLDWYQVRHDIALPASVDAHIVIPADEPGDSDRVRQFQPDTDRVRAAVAELDAAVHEAYAQAKGEPAVRTVLVKATGTLERVSVDQIEARKNFVEPPKEEADTITAEDVATLPEDLIP